MQYVIENECLVVTVNEHGAELAGVLDKKTGMQRIWQANPNVWNRYAPVLFPYCGRLFNNELLVNGKKYQMGQHGFARDMDFTLTQQTDSKLVFRLCDSEKTKEIYPFEFVLEIEFALQAGTVTQTVRVHNPSADKDSVLPFSVGFHPAFALPFRDGGTAQDHEFVFEKEESPLLVKTPGGYVDGNKVPAFSAQKTIELHDDLFENDSLCLEGLQSDTITLQEKNGDRFVQVGIKGFEHVLLWGPPKGPLPFACIEPWNGLPDGPDKYDDFTQKPGITLLKSGEWYETKLVMTFCLKQ